MLRLITAKNRDAHCELLHAMHRDRKRLFVDLLRWKLDVADGEERDGWDDDHAEYLVLEGATPGEHLASLRLLPTDRPHMLDTLFPQLCQCAIPCGGQVREITRLCLPLRRRAPERIAARNILARAIIDYALVRRVSTYTAVCNMAFLSELLSAGWRCDPLGLPQELDGAVAGALAIQICPQTCELLTPAWRCDPNAPRILTFTAGGVSLAA